MTYEASEGQNSRYWTGNWRLKLSKEGKQSLSIVNKINTVCPSNEFTFLSCTVVVNQKPTGLLISAELSMLIAVMKTKKVELRLSS